VDDGGIPYRMALAGGWIDQPFVSRHNPTPPGSMVVVSLVAEHAFLDRCGMATSTRAAAGRLWGHHLPGGEPEALVQELYAAENRDRADPSGSQDMIGLIYPGVSRLDYRADHQGGVFPVRVVSSRDPAVARWLEENLAVIPVAPRPAGYDPLRTKNLDGAWVSRLGRSGAACYDAILAGDAAALGASFNECMTCWEAILPAVLRHPALTVDLVRILRAHQRTSLGAMYSGCGGGYLYVVTQDRLPGAVRFRVRTT
jgi:hypothetical protein